LQELVDSGDTHELARRSLTLQSVMLDLHRQLALVTSQAELARTMALALTGSFGCDRLLVLRRDALHRQFEPVASTGAVSDELHREAAVLAARLAPFLPHVPLLAPLVPPFATAVAAQTERLVALGCVRAVWLHVDKQVDWVVFVGRKLAGGDYDTFDVSLARATLDAAALACSKLLLVDALEERHRALLTANQRLQQLDDLKTAILAGVSHDLRTPLARIQMYAEALRDEPASATEVSEFLSVILSNTRRLSERIDSALQFAELVGGRTAPQPMHVALPALVESVLAHYAEPAADRTVKLSLQCEDLAVYTDPEHLRLLLGALVDNAVKYTPPGGTVRVDAVARDAGALVRIVDGGSGIPLDVQQHMWKPFEPSEGNSRREAAGLGLGLALAQRLAAELGVRLELLATSPEGSSFGVFFADAAPETSPAPSPSREPVPVTRLH
jgi:signal transduction histidine kinase